MTAPVFVVDSLDGTAPGSVVTLEGPEGRHAVSVKRLRAGEDVVLTDGLGRGAAGRVLGTEGKDRLVVEAVGLLAEPESWPPHPERHPPPPGGPGGRARGARDQTRRGWGVPTGGAP
ncbi:RNA methyltransferase PUA domain-containing protein, partial [Streptomyces sp. NPDC058953]|uniref:RNA methyltransferase PUA domain-containing protein n=1 Tax=Streptomyces sp. NPDC058953 TaxID=3346676 RepID=UPI0036A99734